MENVHLYIFFKELQCLTLNKKNSGTIFFRYKSPKRIYLLRIRNHNILLSAITQSVLQIEQDSGMCPIAKF